MTYDELSFALGALCWLYVLIGVGPVIALIARAKTRRLL